MSLLCKIIGHDYRLFSQDELTEERRLNTFLCNRCKKVKREIVKEVKILRILAKY